MAATIVLTCVHCGKNFERDAVQARHKGARNTFCTPEHKWAYDRRHYENFWGSVDKSGGMDACWPWMGSIDGMGYGAIEHKGKLFLAHRRAYELANGPIPKGEGYHGTVVRHTCDTPRCCNPAHLILGTQADNGMDMASRGRAVTKLTKDQVIAIRADTRPYSKIKQEYGLCLATISEIKRRLIWKHIP